MRIEDLKEIINDYDSLKEEKDKYYKWECFYHEIVFEIYDYLRNHPVKKNLKWLYDILTTYFDDCWIKYEWTEKECFAFPYEKLNEEIYEDTAYHYHKKWK